MPKRTLITWAISIVFVTLAYFNVNWNNHPKFVDFLMNQWVAGGVVLGLVGLVLRRWVLRADWEFWSTPLWALAFSMLGARILHHEIPIPAGSTLICSAGGSPCWVS
jgi:RsiW-degrading membrane proteinase PrsW (M82 family)